MTSLARFIFVDHFGLAVDSAILLAVGLFISIPAAGYRIRILQWIPMRIMRLVWRMMGERGGLLRTAGVIWVFNSTVMFLYMAGGFHPLLPKIFAIWTGLNIGIVIAGSRRELQEGGPGFPAPAAPGSRRTSRLLTGVCAVMVPLLELPCFFYSIAMGMRMGAEVSWGGVGYTDALRERAVAYAVLIVPLLLISAVAEAIAIRGTTPGRDIQ